jgi:molybdate transport system substrate-binding protein
MRRWLIAIMVALASSSASASEIRVTAAGSLRGVFAAVFADYTKLQGGSFAPVFGPSGVLRERLQKGEAFDIFASAGLPHAQALTEAGVSGPSVLFTRNALCVVTDADRGLDTGNLVETLLKPEIRIGTSTPVSDPAGDYTRQVITPGRCFIKWRRSGPAPSRPCPGRHNNWTAVPPPQAS